MSKRQYTKPQLEELNVDQAVMIVATQLVASAARDIQWEDYPEIGEYDWLRVEEACKMLTPEIFGFGKAMAVLEMRAERSDIAES